MSRGLNFEERIASCIKAIELAFPNEPLPPPVPPGPQNIEVEECYEAFKGPWTKIEDSVFQRNYSCFCFLEDESIAYYLPTFLRAILKSISSGTDLWNGLDMPVLTALGHVDLISSFITQRQGEAICEFLTIFKTWLDDDDEGLDEMIAHWCK